VVSLNMSAAPQTISLDLKTAGVKDSALTTLLASPSPISESGPAHRITLPPFAAWVAASQ